MDNIYTYSSQAIIIVGAGQDNKLQDSFKTGFVINADTGRITMNGKVLVTEGSLSAEQKQLVADIYNGKLNSLSATDYKFADRKGNVVARIGEEGIRAVGLKIANNFGRVVGSFTQTTCKRIFKFPFSDIGRHDSNDDFIFADKHGNVVARIDAEGVHAVAFYDKDGNKIG